MCDPYLPFCIKESLVLHLCKSGWLAYERPRIFPLTPSILLWESRDCTCVLLCLTLCGFWALELSFSHLQGKLTELLLILLGKNKQAHHQNFEPNLKQAFSDYKMTLKMDSN